MKKTIAHLFTFSLLLFFQTVSAQTTNISFSETIVMANGITVKGEGVSVALRDDKTSEKLMLFKSDTLLISATYRRKQVNKKASEIKDVSFELEIFYTCIYNGNAKEKKVERMYFLNDSMQFTEKETFNMQGVKNAIIPVKIGYKGTVIQ